MKHFFKSTLVVAGLCLTTSGAHAASYPYNGNSWYAGLSGDVTWLQHSNTGGGGNVDLGYQLPASSLGDFRLEGEAGYHTASGDTGYSTTHYLTYMGNIYYDFTTVFSNSSSGWRVVPYIGGGVGDATVHYGSSNLSNTYHNGSNTFAYQGMAGLSFNSTAMPNTDWVLGYDYLGTSKYDIHANNLELGLSFHF